MQRWQRHPYCDRPNNQKKWPEITNMVSSRFKKNRLLHEKKSPKCASLWENWRESQKLKKNWEFGQKKLHTNFLKLEYLLLWPRFNSNLKVDSRFKAFMDNKSQVLATFKGKLLKGHESKYSSFKILEYNSFFICPNSQFFFQFLTLPSVFSDGQTLKWKQNFHGTIQFSTKLLEIISINSGHFFFQLYDHSMSGWWKWKLLQKFGQFAFEHEKPTAEFFKHLQNKLLSGNFLISKEKNAKMTAKVKIVANFWTIYLW